jgi:type I restriction enzyme R subunit
MAPNQNPEQLARDRIDQMLVAAGWVVRNSGEINVKTVPGAAIREYHTDQGPMDYALFVNGKAVGVIEAKREEEGHRLSVVEEQSHKYASANWKYIGSQQIHFRYESTGLVTRFTDTRDPKPRARLVFSFLRPETIAGFLRNDKSLRSRLHDIPTLDPTGLRKAQIKAIKKLEESFRENRPRALVQMATGAGKTFTAATFVYRLLKYADAKRILFLVDTKNLGVQAEQEFMKFRPQGVNRQFTEIYNVQRLTSSHVAPSSQVCISTIQRVYSILKGEELDDSAEETNPNESTFLEQLGKSKEPLPVVYNKTIPLEMFDFIVIDECHRSIYNLWQQVLDYFDAFLIGLTATPDKRTFGFFNENVVSDYTYRESVADGVNVDYEVYNIETEISKEGGVVASGWTVPHRDKLTRRERWNLVDEAVEYSGRSLDKKVVNPSQIRNIIKEFRRALQSTIFPNRFDDEGNYEVPKTLIFAKSDSHADDILRIVREEFGEGNEFCKKVTYKINENPESVINRFRNDFLPRIAVTVDMIATGTDIKALEILLFMRDVKSTNYFEQMKGRGTRTIDNDALQLVSSGARTKTHFVIVDAVGVTKSKKTDSAPLERKRGIVLKDLLGAVAMGVEEEDLFTSLASRLIRLDKQLTSNEKEGLTELTCGQSLSQLTTGLLRAFDLDVISDEAERRKRADPELPAIDMVRETVQQEMIDAAALPFTGIVNDYIENVHRVHEQIIDTHNLDTVTLSEWDTSTDDRQETLIADFTAYIEENKDEITALRLFYGQPYQRRELTRKMIIEVRDALKRDRPALAPAAVWEAFARLDGAEHSRPEKDLVALVALIRRVVGLDQEITPFRQTVDRKFQSWIFNQQSGALKYTPEQVEWLRMLRDHVYTSFNVVVDDLDYTPFDSVGGRGKMHQLFGNGYESVLEDLNDALVA